MTPTVDHLIAAARHWLGAVEIPDGSNRVKGITDWYGLDGSPWCAMTVSRAFSDAGFVDAIDFTTSKGFAYCPSGIAGFQKRGQWHGGVAGIRAGDVLFYDWEGDGVSDHVGIVEYVDASGIHTIEGNSNNRCERRVRNANIVGYGRPAYDAPKPPAPQGGPFMALTDAQQQQLVKDVADTKAELAAVKQELDGAKETLGHIFAFLHNLDVAGALQAVKDIVADHKAGK